LIQIHKLRNIDIRRNGFEFLFKIRIQRKGKFDILLDIEIGLDCGKELCMQWNPSKFLVNALSWQILEIQHLWCYKPTPLKGISPSRFRRAQKQLEVICSEIFIVLPGSFIFRMVSPLNIAHLNNLITSHLLCRIQNFNQSLTYVKSSPRSRSSIGSCSFGTHKHFLSCDT
jgi:hypothetical protein